MSYDFYIGVDTGGEEEHYVEPYFDDDLPALDGQGGGGMTAVVTNKGYARCGNYTSNVSGMWRKCLTGALDSHPDARAWIGDDDRLSIERYGPTFNGAGGTVIEREVATDALCLRDLAGKRAEDLVPLLTAAVAWGIEHLDELRADNPDNGWGDAEGAITYLWDIQRMCERHPHGTLRISS